MSTELHDALAQAADAGRARFDTRDATEVITPAARRVARHRTTVRFGAGLASVVAIAGLLWGVDVLGARDVATVDPAMPTFAPGDTIDAESLMGSLLARDRGEARTTMAALRCDAGQDNPHLNVPTTPGRAYVFSDCAPVWAPDSLALSERDGTLDSDPDAGTVTWTWALHNDSSAPVLVDREGIVGVLTTQSAGDAEEIGVNGMALSATTTWTPEGTEVTVLSSASDVVTLQPGESLTGATTWRSSEDGDLVSRAAAGDEEVAVALHARIAPSGEASGTELLAVVDSGFRYRFGGEDARPGDAWSVEELDAIAEPRAQGEARDDATAGMICEFADPATDPRLLADTGGNDVVQSTEAWIACDPVWFVGGPRTEVATLSTETSAQGAVIEAEFENLSGRELLLDYASEFAWLETDPLAVSVRPHVYEHSAVDASMWTDDGKVMVQVGPDNGYSTNQPNVVGAINLVEPSAEGELRTVLIRGDYTLSYWARVHDEHPAGSKTYLVQLGETTVFTPEG